MKDPMKVKPFSERLNEALTITDTTQAELCRMTGIPTSAMSQYATGKFEPRQRRLTAIAKALDIEEAWLMGYDIPMGRMRDNKPQPVYIRVPILGEAPCGYPIETDQNVQGYEIADYQDKVTYALIAHGDSMDNAGIKDGDTVFVRRQSTVDNNDIAVVVVDGETTIKRFVDYKGDTVALKPDSTNPEHKEQVYSKSQHHIEIQGKVIFTKTYVR